jgi:hypothetical protein
VERAGRDIEALRPLIVTAHGRPGG